MNKKNYIIPSIKMIYAEELLSLTVSDAMGDGEQLSKEAVPDDGADIWEE